MKKIYIAFGVILFVGLLGAFLLHKSENVGVVKKSVDEQKVSVQDKKAIEKFIGKPAFVFIAGTFCPHCKKTLPLVEEKIYKTFAGRIGFFVQVMDGKNGKKMDAHIPQGYDKNLTYKAITGEECNYIPSWVVLDKSGFVVEKSCGGSTSLDIAVQKITELLK